MQGSTHNSKKEISGKGKDSSGSGRARRHDQKTRQTRCSNAQTSDSLVHSRGYESILGRELQKHMRSQSNGGLANQQSSVSLEQRCTSEECFRFNSVLESPSLTFNAMEGMNLVLVPGENHNHFAIKK
jgi:hypothetical protein